MEKAATTQKVLISRSASDMAFDFGQALERVLIQAARERARSNGDGLVRESDVLAVFPEIDVTTLLDSIKAVSHGSEESGWLG